LENLSVLVAEDVDINFIIVEDMLKRAGANVSAAVNGQETINVLKKKKFDIILMDIQMPVMGGIEATKAIRTNGDKTPIIAMTGSSQELAETFYQAGMDDFLEKPVCYDTLVEKVAEHAIPPSAINS
jgi:CheY-like chemotaxis protein